MQQKSKYRWLLGLLCSLAFLGIPVFTSPDFRLDTAFLRIRPFQRDFLSYVLLLVFFFVNMRVFLPKLYFRRRYFLFACCILLSFLLTTFLPLWLLPRGPYLHPAAAGQVPFPPCPGAHEPALKRIIGQYLFQFIAVAICSFSLKLNEHWKLAEKARTEAELGYLKAQVNPHFLFNTLNSIYALAIDRSARTAAAIVQLSEIMRYMMNQSMQDTVALHREIAYIRDYISLILLRLDEHAGVHIEIYGDPGAKTIAPMLLIPFIENAFKYGINPDEPSDILIRIRISDEALSLETRNRKVNRAAPVSNNGLGIRNARERLESHYPGRHQLVLNDDGIYFHVLLRIFIS